jgi:hypothetical protein
MRELISKKNEATHSRTESGPINKKVRLGYRTIFAELDSENEWTTNRCMSERYFAGT